MSENIRFEVYDKGGRCVSDCGTEVRSKQTAWRIGGYVARVTTPTPIIEIIYDKRDAGPQS